MYKIDRIASNLNFWINAPENEREEALHLTTIFSSLDGCVNSLRAAILLYSCKFDLKIENAKDLNVAWRFLAARDGVISIYNFIECFEAIKTSARNIPSIEQKIDWP